MALLSVCLSRTPHMGKLNQIKPNTAKSYFSREQIAKNTREFSFYLLNFLKCVRHNTSLIVLLPSISLEWRVEADCILNFSDN